MTLNRDQREAIKRLFQSWNDPVKFAYEALGLKKYQEKFPNFDLTTQQKEYLTYLGALVTAKIKMAVGDPLTKKERELSIKRGISVRAGQGPGKTAVAALSAIWFVSVFQNSIVPCFAPVGAQMRSNLWKEIGKWVSIMDEYGHPAVRGTLEIQSDKIFHKNYFISGKTKEEWAILAKTVKETADPDAQGKAARGVHGDFMMILLDEASNLKDGLIEVLLGTMSDPVNFIVMISNPTRTRGYFFDSHNSHSEFWIPLHWSNEDCERIPKELIFEKEHRFGRNSSKFQIDVLGNFADISKEEFIAPYLIDQAFAEDNAVNFGKNDPILVGVDPAGRGKDRTVVCQRQGGVITGMWVVDSDNELHIANWLAAYNKDIKPDAVMIDSTGLGGPIAARCEELGLPVYRVNFAAKAKNPGICDRVRDELIWTMRPWFVEGRINFEFSDPSMNYAQIDQIRKDLKEEISTIRYVESGNTNLQRFENKTLHKKRLGGRSPDLFDALALSFYWDDSVFYEDKEEEEFESWLIRDEDHDGSWMGV